MIVSHKHKYLFIEIPLSGSWSIRHELCAYYDGSPFLHKHASYSEFQRSATPATTEYFVFATVRNPLDEAVSRYFKLKTDHKGVFSDPESVQSLKADYADREKYKFIKNSNATFTDFFRKYYRRTFSGLIDVSDADLDFVMRFETLQDDFSEVLRLLNIGQVRAVPVTNKTQSRKADWESYYTSEIIPQAKRVFAPFMKKWGYEFPDSWGDYHVTWIDTVRFRMLSTIRRLYLIHFRFNNRPYARVMRRLRAYLIE